MGRVRTALLATGVVAMAGLSANAVAAQGFAASDFYLKGFGGATWPQDQDGDVKSERFHDRQWRRELRHRLCSRRRGRL